MFHSLLPGDTLLRATLSLENLGRWQNKDAHAWPKLSSCKRGNKMRETKITRRLFCLEFAFPKFLCIPIFLLRSPKLHQRGRPDIFHGLLPRWRILDVWSGRRKVHGIRAWRSGRSYVPRFPEGYQMYLPQIWCVRYRTKVRRSLRSTVEHRQREDLRVPLVLVHYPVDSKRS